MGLRKAPLSSPSWSSGVVGQITSLANLLRRVGYPRRGEPECPRLRDGRRKARRSSIPD